MRHSSRAVIAALLISLAAASRTPAQPAPGATRETSGFDVPGSCTVSFGSLGPADPQPPPPQGEPSEEPQAGTEGDAASAGPGRVRLSDYVDITCGDFRIQADTVVYDPRTQRGYAEGVVVLDWGPNRITGARLDFDLANRTGAMEDAMGWVEPEVILDAARLTKLDEDHVLLEKGSFTSCTQPIPYWSFKVGRGMFHLDHYAHLRHVRLHVGKVPVLYLPYVLWPIKGERATGFLFPEWGASQKYGWFVGEGFFWPFAMNADVTLFGYYFGDGGPGAAIESNWLPSERGKVLFTGFYLDDNFRDEERWMAHMQIRQPFGRGWRLTGDLNEVSDFLYYQDFDRTLGGSSTTVVLSRLSLVHNGAATSLNLELQRRRQFFPSFSNVVLAETGELIEPTLRSELIQETLPGIEWRGRSRPIGRSPLYFSFESSADYFRCDQKVYTPSLTPQCSDASWARLDAEPRVALPMQPAPWLSIEGRASARGTWYTAARDPLTGVIDDEDRVDRTYPTVEVESIGPRLYRIFASDSAFSPSYKHLIEPRLVYQYVPTIDEQERVPIIDERDPAAGDLNLVTVSIASRLFAKRPSRLEPATIPRGPTPGETTGGGTLPWSSFPTPVETPPPPPPVPPAPEAPSGTPRTESEEPAPGSPPESGEPAPSPPAESGQASEGAAAGASAPAPSDPESTAAPRVGQSPAPATPSSTPPSSAAAPIPAARPSDTVEIMNISLSQTYSFGNPLTTIFDRTTRCPDGTPPPCTGGEDPVPVFTAVETRSYGPLSLLAHFNPTMTMSIDARADYDLANSDLAATALSGWYRWGSGYANSTWVRQRFAGSALESEQLRIGAGAQLLNRKLTLDGEVGYDFERSGSLDRRARAGYYTQCCGFVVEYLERNFETNPRREIRFMIDLKGIGRILDPNVSLGR